MFVKSSFLLEDAKKLLADLNEVRHIVANQGKLDRMGLQTSKLPAEAANLFDQLLVLLNQARVNQKAGEVDWEAFHLVTRQWLTNMALCLVLYYDSAVEVAGTEAFSGFRFTASVSLTADKQNILAVYTELHRGRIGLYFRKK